MRTKITEILEAHIVDGNLVVPKKEIELVSWGRRCTQACLPNLDRVVELFEAIIDELCTLGETDEARKIFNMVFNYVASETRKYANYESGYRWEHYAGVFDAGSPCCMCDLQSSLSSTASANRLEDLARYVVSVHCPVSPDGYRRDISAYKRDEESWGWAHKRNIALIERWDSPTFEFFWEQSHTRRR